MIEYSKDLQECCLPFLEAGEAKIILNVMSRLYCTAGTQLFEHGEVAEGMYFLVMGRIAVQNKTGFGDSSQVVALLDPGAPVGEGGLIKEIARGATLTAVTDSELLSLSQQDFDTLVDEHPLLAIKLLKWLLSRLSMRLKKNSERLAHIL